MLLELLCLNCARMSFVSALRITHVARLAAASQFSDWHEMILVRPATD